ncbi:GntR family transcriptional regulator YhfZ [Xylanimonas ulmi]|uniref:Helix-turn-helix protein n=1 Tax=Xylanimonas ulmi TaxID=228973 RepID=A0A4Q7M4Q8_9MICO|nr:GntR family transcriptional regulator YhfZ [Xylanibacterium ulmi]RZS62371.1 helix-turn-helix protein [Xylanibacterium ulmi]
MSRAGLAAARLADALSGLNTGDRVPRVQDLAGQFGCGRGTVQAAFGLLENAGALRLVARGHLGTFVDAIDHRVLWQLSGDRSVSLAMPLPYTPRYEGLATGLAAGFEATGVPLTLAFMRGSAARLRSLREGRSDYVLLSSLAMSTEEDLEVVRDFGDGSYVASHVTVLAEGKQVTDPDLRIAVDRSSADVVTLVRRVFGDVPADRLVDVSYNHLDHGFRAKTIDATVWNADEIRRHISAPITTLPLPAALDSSDTRAVIVRVRSDVSVPVAVLDAFTNPVVVQLAHDVVAGNAIPSY